MLDRLYYVGRIQDDLNTAGILTTWKLLSHRMQMHFNHSAV